MSEGDLYVGCCICSTFTDSMIDVCCTISCRKFNALTVNRIKVVDENCPTSVGIGSLTLLRLMLLGRSLLFSWLGVV